GVIGDQKCTCSVDAHPDRASAGLVTLEEISHHILCHSGRLAVFERYIDDLVAIEVTAVPTAVFADEGTVAKFFRQGGIIGKGQAKSCNMTGERIIGCYRLLDH